MIEVFLCFHSEDKAIQLLDTAERWRKTKGAYPTIIQVPEEGFEIKRRMLADKLSKDDIYIIADILCVPAMPKFIQTVKQRFINLGMAGINYRGFNEPLKYPTGIRVCKKGLVEKWPQQITKTYDKEHAEAIRSTGSRVETWPDVIYFKLNENDN